MGKARLTMNNMRLPKRLRELRKSAGWDQEFVASKLNITRQAYSHYETGRNNPPNEALYRLAELYDIPSQEFLKLLEVSPVDYNTIDAPTETANMLSDYLNYLDDPSNQKKLNSLNKNEKKLLFYFEQLSIKDQDDILEFIMIKAKKK